MLNIEEQKRKLLDLTGILYKVEACNVLYEGFDEEYRVKKVEELEWEYKKALQALTTETLNKDNVRIYQPESVN